MLHQWYSRLFLKSALITILFAFIYALSTFSVQASLISNVFINEIHYDNQVGDINEAVEIAGDGSIDLFGWSLHLYNGSSKEEYNSFTINKWSNIDTKTNVGFLSVTTKGLQNGSPDGVALFDGSNLIQFLSYEGSFTAISGVAKGITSIDIGVSQATNSPIGFSLQLMGHGKKYNDFTWSTSTLNTFGLINSKQSFISEKSSAIQVSEPSSLLLLCLSAILLLCRFHFVNFLTSNQRKGSL